jgi:hypothetical protein
LALRPQLWRRLAHSACSERLDVPPCAARVRPLGASGGFYRKPACGRADEVNRAGGASDRRACVPCLRLSPLARGRGLFPLPASSSALSLRPSAYRGCAAPVAGFIVRPAHGKPNRASLRPDRLFLTGALVFRSCISVLFGAVFLRSILPSIFAPFCVGLNLRSILFSRLFSPYLLLFSQR